MRGNADHKLKGLCDTQLSAVSSFYAVILFKGQGNIKTGAVDFKHVQTCLI